MSDVFFILKNIKHAFPEGFSLDIPYLEINRGEVFTIIGPNGAGKTTLLRIMSLLKDPQTGEVIFNHSDLSSKLGLRRKISFVFQDASLFKGSVFDNVALPLRIRGFSKDEITGRVQKILNLFKIEHLNRHKARSLSGGEAKRVSLAQGLVSEPELLLLDEPGANLDPVYKETLFADLIQMVRRKNVSTVFVTQDRLEAMRFSDRIAVLINGQILQAGVPLEIFNHPKNEAVAKFVGQEAVLDGVVAESQNNLAKIKVNSHIIEAAGDFPAGLKVMLCIPPQDVIISKTQPKEKTSSRNVLEAVIKNILPQGLFYKIELDNHGKIFFSFITHQSLEDLELKKGDEIFALFKATAVHVIAKGK